MYYSKKYYNNFIQLLVFNNLSLQEEDIMTSGINSGSQTPQFGDSYNQSKYEKYKKYETMQGNTLNEDQFKELLADLDELTNSNDTSGEKSEYISKLKTLKEDYELLHAQKPETPTQVITTQVATGALQGIQFPEDFHQLPLEELTLAQETVSNPVGDQRTEQSAKERESKEGDDKERMDRPTHLRVHLTESSSAADDFSSNYKINELSGDYPQFTHRSFQTAVNLREKYPGEFEEQSKSAVEQNESTNENITPMSESNEEEDLGEQSPKEKESHEATIQDIPPSSDTDEDENMLEPESKEKEVQEEEYKYFENEINQGDEESQNRG